MKERGGSTVLVVDAGGRGTSLVHKYSRSPHVESIIAVPGNDWMSKISEKPVTIFPEIEISDAERIALLCRKSGVDLVDVSSEKAVQAGLVNKLKDFKIAVVGPTREAGEIEWNKEYSRAFGKFFNLPQPSSVAFRAEKEAEEFLNSQEHERWFVKAAGLAEGKGAIPATSSKEVLAAIKWLKKEYPESTEVFLIEEWIEGEEFSAFAIVSEKRDFEVLGYAQDHKREYDQDKGENTGGMGAVSNPLLTNNLRLQRDVKKIFATTINGRPGDGYKGILYLGGMETYEGVKVIEFNARWGDPEAQVIVPGLNVDFFEMGMEVASGSLKRIKISNDGKVRVAVAGVARGYPRYKEYSQVKGKEITGLDQAEKTDGVTVYGAGIKIENGKHYANGGRLFYVVGEGENVVQARERAYEAMEKVKIDGNNLHFRKDIGYRDVQRLRK